MTFLPTAMATKEILKRLGRFLAEWWVEILVVALCLAIYAQQTRVWARDETIAKRDRAIDQMKAAAALAESKSAERGATSGQEAVSTYVERNEADRPVVERVVERVRNVCLRSPDPVRVSVPQGAAAPDGAKSRTQDDEDRAFAEDVADDLRTCQAELNKLDSLRAWIVANGG